MLLHNPKHIYLEISPTKFVFHSKAAQGYRLTFQLLILLCCVHITLIMEKCL